MTLHLGPLYLISCPSKIVTHASINVSFTLFSCNRLKRWVLLNLLYLRTSMRQYMGFKKCKRAMRPLEVLNHQYKRISILLKWTDLPSPRIFPMDSRFLDTITSRSFALSSSLMPRVPTANDSHSGHSYLPLMWTAWYEYEHTCDSNSMPVVGSLWSVLNDWLQLVTTEAKRPPAGGDREVLKVRVWNTTGERKYCAAAGSGEDIARKSSGVSAAVLLFFQSEPLDVTHFQLHPEWQRWLTTRRSWMKKTYISSCFVHPNGCTVTTGFS